MITEAVSMQGPQTANFEPAVEQRQRTAEEGHLRPQGKEGKANIELLRDVLEVAEEHFHVKDIGLKFNIHEATGRVKVTVTDKETGDLVREIPPEQVLDLMAKIEEMMGVLFDHSA